MATFSIGGFGSSMGTNLTKLLECEDMEPGSDASYELCKLIYLYHPLGGKIAEEPIKKAQFKPREIAIPDSPDDIVRKAFVDEWHRMKCDELVFNHGTLCRVYGLASLAVLSEGVPLNLPLDLKGLPGSKIGFNVYDPLNTAGSLVLSQTPDHMDFLKAGDISVSGKEFHRSRAVVLMNENPIFLGYTTSAFGYVGRSAYQRALYPLKTFVQTMRTDDMVSVKAGVLVAKMKQPGSFVNNLMQGLAGIKRAMLSMAMTGNVLSITPDEDIESLNLTNIDGAGAFARKNCIENIASAVPMPAKLLLQETFAEGFGEGTEDAKYVSDYVEGVRRWLQPDYDFLDKIVRYRAWNEDFYKTIQQRFPNSYSNKTHTQAFYEWSNSFSATWPSLITEPESELIKVEEVLLKAAIAVYEVLSPAMDPENRSNLIRWLADCFNERKKLFSSPLELDFDALKDYVPEKQLQEPAEPKPFAAQDAVAGFGDAMARLSAKRLDRSSVENALRKAIVNQRK
jgi:hypothetical protein